ncbi:hypothetical protein TSTA_079020 [Talaromyces stipitatus ATCC 10500]|uniref:Uncharacterized protein n=1 Tax=Talaromyces stipitatus (strain ATCC 10500 / CBS 375.48 / QM 6759 / NRRL 1006) TaxID=441959 RepID=B8LXP4_TALSN|nr:uncharacterized protein TSTA_079020 [Talaromyces stipitatus ATCC 10500]EED24545.1 hypothetical protein TSTA_079020 [Talaromyces stipitatus ATCC 10500]
MLLWAFNFENPIDLITGQRMEPDTNPDTGYIEGLAECLESFRVRYETIMREFAKAKVDAFSKYDENVEI